MEQEYACVFPVMGLSGRETKCAAPPSYVSMGFFLSPIFPLRYGCVENLTSNPLRSGPAVLSATLSSLARLDENSKQRGREWMSFLSLFHNGLGWAANLASPSCCSCTSPLRSPWDACRYQRPCRRVGTCQVHFRTLKYPSGLCSLSLRNPWTMTTTWPAK